MGYLKEKDVASFNDVEDDMRQVFHHEFSKNVYKNEIISMKQKNSITEEDLEVAKKLFSFRFATAEQLHVLVDSQKSDNAFKSRLNKLLQYRIVNKFMMTNSYEDRIEKDAFEVYCLDLGGQFLLSHFWNDEDILDWYHILNIVTSQLVARALLITKAGIAFKNTNPSNMVYFKPNPELRLGAKTMIPAFEVCLKDGSEETYFLGEVVRSQEVANIFREKVHKWNQLLLSNTWMKYYKTESGKSPVLLVMTGNDSDCLYAGKVLVETGELEKFRLTTESRVEKPLYDQGAFLRFVPQRKAIAETKIRNFLSVEALEEERKATATDE